MKEKSIRDEVNQERDIPYEFLLWSGCSYGWRVAHREVSQSGRQVDASCGSAPLNADYHSCLVETLCVQLHYPLSRSAADAVYRVRLAPPCTIHVFVLRRIEVLVLHLLPKLVSALTDEEGSCCRPGQAPEALTRFVPCLTINLGATNAEAGQRPRTQGRTFVHFIVYLTRAVNRRREQQTKCSGWQQLSAR